ncbi:MAG: hypothetical protein HOB29_12080 [Planctomycetaceae bacterium]|jgi:hypothetical protein|nr:hypothetical protein [Planctomycetaceae bacterium]MBT5123601.1 hypothetical protein [Planctomycetaceae bacterium]
MALSDGRRHRRCHLHTGRPIARVSGRRHPAWALVTVIDGWDELPEVERNESAQWVVEQVEGYLVDVRDEAKACYLANLQRRADNEAFGGLPRWQRHCLKGCDEQLDEELCDVCEVPRGSTIGHSVEHGKHKMALG